MSELGILCHGHMSPALDFVADCYDHGFGALVRDLSSGCNTCLGQVLDPALPENLATDGLTTVNSCVNQLLQILQSSDSTVPPCMEWVNAELVTECAPEEMMNMNGATTYSLLATASMILLINMAN